MRRMMAVALLLGAGWACSSDKASRPDATAPASEAPPPDLIITSLRVVDETPAEQRPLQLSAQALEEPWRNALTAAGFEFGDRRADAVDVRLDVRAVYGLTKGEGLLKTVQPARAELRWAANARMRAPGADVRDNAWFDGQDGRAFEGDLAALQRSLLALAAGAVKGPVADLKARATLLTLPAPALIARLKSKDVQIRLAAVDRLGVLRATEAVDPLIALTRTETARPVKLRVVGALAEIGDDSAAKALISLANPRDREMLRAVVEALSVVGGARVSDFLDILSAHDAPDVREMVEAARARLARKAKQQ